MRLFEELNDYQKSLVDEWKPSDRNEDDDTHDEVFSRLTNDPNAKRIVMPFTASFDKAVPPTALTTHLYNNGGWTVHNYSEGTATRKLTTKKGFVKPEFKSIGSILKETGGDKVSTSKRVYDRDYDTHKIITSNLYDDFVNDEKRSTSKKPSHQIVISRDPYDVAGMSTGRSWSSCMTMKKSPEDTNGGCNSGYIQDDLHHRTLAAYLTRKGDDNIEKPVARVLLKKHENEYGHTIWRPEEATYGTANDSFLRTIKHFAIQHYPATPDTEYEKHHDLYDDSTYEGDEDITGIPHGATIHSSKKDELNRLHTDNDEPSLEYDLDDKHTQWHKNGQLHRENGPAHIINRGDINDPTHVREEMHYQHGLLHSPKDGVTPSEDVKQYQNGKLARHTINYHKFNKLHDSVINGIASISVDRNNFVVKKYQYGTPHTNDDTPSYFEYNHGDNWSKTTKLWQTYGFTHKRDIEHIKDGQITAKHKGEYFIGDDRVNHIDIEKHENKWGVNGYDPRDHRSKPTGLLKRRVDGYTYNGKPVVATENIEYTDDHYTDDPKHITNYSIKTDGMYVDSKDDKPSYVYNDGRRHEEKHFYNQTLHRVSGPARINKEFQPDGSLASYEEQHYVHGERPSGNGIVAHYWHSSGNNTYGQIVRHHDGLSNKISYKGELTDNPKPENINSVTWNKISGEASNGPNGEPHHISDHEFIDANTSYNNKHDKWRITKATYYKQVKKSDPNHKFPYEVSALLDDNHNITIRPQNEQIRVTLSDKNNNVLGSHHFDTHGNYIDSTVNPMVKKIDVNNSENISMSNIQDIQKKVPEWYTPGEKLTLEHFTKHLKMPSNIKS